MIIKVFSESGTPLYVKVKAASLTQARYARDQLAKVAATRTTRDLLADDYYLTERGAQKCSHYC